MFKRFLQNNLLLVIVMGVSLVAVFGLLGLTATQHIEMRDVIDGIQRLRDKIKDLQKGEIAPVQENLDRIRVDIKLYQEKKDAAVSLYGRPCIASRDVMAKMLGLKDGAEMRAKFLELYGKEKENSTRGQIYDRFRRTFGDKWNPAMEEFRKRVDVVMVEPVDDRNKDAILLDQLGIPRDCEGDGAQVASIIAVVEKRLADFYQEQKVALASGSAHFGIPAIGVGADQTSIVNTLRLLEIASDLGRRIGKSGIRSLEELSVQEVAPPVDEDGFQMYNFNVVVVGKQSAIRKLVDLLNAAYPEGRVYVVQSLEMSRLADEAAEILSNKSNAKKEELPAPKSAVDSGEKKEEAEPVVDESKLPYNERKGYAAPVLGINEYCMATLSVVYVMRQEQ